MFGFKCKKGSCTSSEIRGVNSTYRVHGALHSRTWYDFYFPAELEAGEGNLIRIKSPNHPKKYPKNAYQFWDIRAPQDFVLSLSFDNFNLKTDHAYLYFGDGL